MALNNPYADAVLSSELNEVVVLLQKLRLIAKGQVKMTNDIFLKPIRVNKCFKLQFHHAQKGILFELEKSKIGGSLLLKYQQLKKEVDYTKIDRVKIDGQFCIVGTAGFTPIDQKNDRRHDLIYSGQKRRSNGSVPSENTRLAKSKKPFLVIAQTKIEIILLGFYIVRKTIPIKSGTFTHKFYMERIN